MIFQEPMTSLNPLLTVGQPDQRGDRAHQGVSRREAMARAVEMLRRVPIPDPEQRAHAYPHQLSGGMRQRVMIAMALSCEPKVLIADEPTTALDVTIQAQILDLIRELQAAFGMAMVLITHDMGVVAENADRVVVMYAGRKVEEAGADDLFDGRRTPTRGACSAPSRIWTRPPSAARRAAAARRDQGHGALAGALPPGCTFAPRCGFATDVPGGIPAAGAAPARPLGACWNAERLAGAL